MNALMIYYSFEGNTDYVASKFKEYLDIDTERLTVMNEPPKKGLGKFLHGGKSALRKEDPRMNALQADVQAYDTILIAFPVWAGTCPPAIDMCLKTYPFKDKNVYIIATSASGNAKKAMINVTEMMAGNLIVDTLSLTSPLKNKEKTDAQIQEFCQKITGRL
ncbi:MAG: NAD(P)H-dependent oxidoreductase [Erysipelotrichaceae bacterium]|nr:NAD(P)H-dependent oxidoreductase [Erysipelotrichaceae bacterium]